MATRKPFIAGNWKMYKTCEEAIHSAKTLVEKVKGVTHADIMIAPPYTALYAVSSVVKESNVGLGGQNLYFEKQGAFTGEISGEMLLSAGCQYVIIGHSERRQFFGDTDLTVNQKINRAIESGLIPVFCIGETESERDANETFSVLDKQVKKGLEGIFLNSSDQLIIAYEPVWAIGTGKTATIDQAQEAHHYIRSLIKTVYNEQMADQVRILYGGSVKPNNIKELMTMSDVDGALVGGASLDAESFSQIVKF